MFLLSISHSPVFPTPKPLPSSPFYSLLLVGWSSLFFHFTCIPMFIRIPRDPHKFKGFFWNLFQTPNSVRWGKPNGTISPWLLISLGFCFTPTSFIIGWRLANHLRLPQVVVSSAHHPNLRVGLVVIRPMVNCLPMYQV